MALVCSWIILLVPLISAHLCSELFSRGQSRRFFTLCLIVLWMTLAILPVQFLGALEIPRVIHRVTVTELALLQIAILAAAFALYFAYRPASANRGEPSVGTIERLPFFLKLSAGIILCSYLLFAIDLLTTLPKGSDALSYHIPLALRWLQEGSLRIPADKAWEFSLPGNGEIVGMLVLATGKQSLIPLASWVSSLLLAIAAYPLALRFSNGKRAAALASTLIVFTIPIVEFQTFSVYVDLFGTALLFAAVALFEHRYRSELGAQQTTQGQRLSLASLALAGLACGLAVGTKTSFLPYCALFFAIAVCILWRERSIHRRPFPLLCGIFIVCILLPSAFWYVRAFQATGDPLYPTGVSLGRHVIFPGYQPATSPGEKLLIDHPPGGVSTHGDKKFVRRPSEWWIYPWTEWLANAGDFPIVYGEASGFGGAFATFVVVGIGLAAYWCLFRSATNPAPGISRGMMFLWLVCLLIWIFAMHRVLRFGLPVWVFACLLSAPPIALLMKAYPTASAALLVFSIAATCAVSSLVPIHDLAGHLSSGKWSRSAVYAYPAFIDELPPGTCILNDSVLPEKDFAFAGKKLTNTVVTAFEAPRELTPAFIASRNIDYVVQISPAAAKDSSPPAALSESVAAAEVLHSTQFGQAWSIWKIKK